MALTVSPAGPGHAEVFLRWRQGTVARRFNPFKATSVEELQKRLAETGGGLADRTKTEYRFVVELDGRPIGGLGLKNVNWLNGNGEISYLFDPEFHGRGLASRAVAMFVRMLFRETNLEHLTATIDPAHEASMRIVKKLGFREEGRYREHVVIDGRRRDQVIFGLLRREHVDPFPDPGNA